MAPDEENKTEYRAPLTSVDLRNNKLKGSIILGNYEVSINESITACSILYSGLETK